MTSFDDDIHLDNLSRSIFVRGLSKVGASKVGCSPIKETFIQVLVLSILRTPVRQQSMFDNDNTITMVNL